MKNTINEILRELRENEVVEVIPSKYKFKHSVYADTESMMNPSDFAKHKHDVKLRGGLNFPVVIVGSQILDGRNRQKACIELNIPMKVLYLKGTYTDDVLFEFVRSIHMTKSKNAVQKQIQAYKFKSMTTNVTWLQAAEKYGISERSVKTINTLFNNLNKHGYGTQFKPIIEKLFMGLNIRPTDCEWVTKNTASCYSLNEMLKKYLDQEYKRQEDGDIDTTEVDPDTGEFLKKSQNYYNRVNDNSFDERDETIANQKAIITKQASEIKTLKAEVNSLKKSVDMLITKLEELTSKPTVMLDIEEMRSYLLANYKKTGRKEWEIEDMDDEEVEDEYREVKDNG